MSNDIKLGDEMCYVPEGGNEDVPLMAFVAHAWPDNQHVNLAIFNRAGAPIQNPPTAIRVIGSWDERPLPGNYCMRRGDWDWVQKKKNEPVERAPMPSPVPTRETVPADEGDESPRIQATDDFAEPAEKETADLPV